MPKNAVYCVSEKKPAKFGANYTECLKKYPAQQTQWKRKTINKKMEYKNPKQTKTKQTPIEILKKKNQINKQTKLTNQTKMNKPPNTEETNQNTHRTLLQNITTHCVSLLDMEEEGYLSFLLAVAGFYAFYRLQQLKSWLWPI